MANPYAPPGARVADSATLQDDLGDASRLRRFVNQVIDAIGYLILSMLIGVVMAFVYPAFIESSSALGDYAFGYSVLTLYYVGFEAFLGRTLGKLVTGTRVVTEDGEEPTFLQILGRTLARFIPFEAFSFFGREGRGWHDRMSHTRVVLTRR
ncbi:MAG TPA: RDD family protein [Gammaproteobacteria bacterium]|nr:RDD family protein [Gammaproteobacteria bacterium]